MAALVLDGPSATDVVTIWGRMVLGSLVLAGGGRDLGAFATVGGDASKCAGSWSAVDGCVAGGCTSP